MPHPWTVSAGSDTKGRCVVAAQPLVPGALIMIEEPLLLVDAPSVFTRAAGSALPEAEWEASYWAGALEALARGGVIQERLERKARPADHGYTAEQAELVLAAYSEAEGELPGMAGQEAAELLAELAAAVAYNCFSVAAGELRYSVAVHDFVSFLNHSCRPNVTADQVGGLHQAMAAADGDKVFTATRSVEGGEELTISYLSAAELRRDVLYRRQRLSHWGFTCQCERCSAEDQLDR